MEGSSAKHGLMDVAMAIAAFSPLITESWLRRNSQLPRVKVGKKCLYRAEDILALITPEKRGPGRPLLRSKSGAKLVPQTVQNSASE